MNKCLVTKLKASIGNEELSKYNVITIKTKAVESPNSNTQWIGFAPYNEGDVISVNSPNVGLYYSGISGELVPYPYNISNASYASEFHFENKDGIIEITGKYNLGQLIVGLNGTVRMKEIYGIPKLKGKVIFSQIEEEEFDAAKFLSILDKENIINLTLPNSNYINKVPSSNIGLFTKLRITNTAFPLLFNNPSLDDLANCVNLTHFDCYNFNSGSLSSFAPLKNIIQLTFANELQLTGDIMDFINPWIAAGRTSGKLTVNWLLEQKSITLNGSPITYPSGVSDSNAYLNWTSDGTVTFTAS